MNFLKPALSMTFALSMLAGASVLDAARAAPVCKAPLNLPFWTCSQELSANGGVGTEGPAVTATAAPSAPPSHPNCDGGDPGTHPGPHGPEGNKDHGGGHPDHDHGTGPHAF